MENLSECPLCGKKAKAYEFLVCRDYLVTGEDFELKKCKECSFVYTNPRPDNQSMGGYYQSEDYISHSEIKETLRDRIYHSVKRFMLNRKASLVNNLVPGKKTILDIGCGTGSFLEYISSEQNSVVGFEPAEIPRQKAIERGIRVLSEEKDLERTVQIDVITLWHVLEHIPDFKQKLDLYYSLLNPGGYLVIAVPNYKSLDASFYRQYWAAYDVPRHLYHFDNETIIKAAGHSRFTLKQIKGLPFDSFYISLVSESYMKKSLGAFRGFLIGASSYLLGLLRIRPWSSQIYIFRKN